MKYHVKIRHDIVTVQVPRSERDTWKAAASARGLSFTAYVRKLINDDVKRYMCERCVYMCCGECEYRYFEGCPSPPCESVRIVVEDVK